jgi:uncharacterized membrane protein required for colicin V production
MKFNWKDFAIFAVILFVAPTIMGFMDGLTSGFFSGLGTVGSVIGYVVSAVPVYLLAKHFWRGRR